MEQFRYSRPTPPAHPQVVRHPQRKARSPAYDRSCSYRDYARGQSGSGSSTIVTAQFSRQQRLFPRPNQNHQNFTANGGECPPEIDVKYRRARFARSFMQRRKRPPVWRFCLQYVGVGYNCPPSETEAAMAIGGADQQNRPVDRSRSSPPPQRRRNWRDRTAAVGGLRPRRLRRSWDRSATHLGGGNDS